MSWNKDLARRFVDWKIEDMPRWANDMSHEIERLKDITDEDLAHPALMRAFFRGACGWDLARDCTMTFFYAICLGDVRVYDDLERKHKALDRALSRGLPKEKWEPVQAAWLAAQDAFWARDDIKELERLAESGVSSHAAA